MSLWRGAARNEQFAQHSEVGEGYTLHQLSILYGLIVIEFVPQ